MLVDTVLADSRFKKETSLEMIPLKKATRLRFLKFQLLSFWGKGGGLQHFSAVPAEGCTNTQGPSIVRSVNPSNFPASNLLTLNSVLDRQNYWLAKKGRTEGQGFTVKVDKCSRWIAGFQIKNKGKGVGMNWATHDFCESGSLNINGPWKILAKGVLKDTTKDKPARLYKFFFHEPKLLQFLKFDLVSFWGSEGDGLQYFGAIPATSKS